MDTTSAPALTLDEIDDLLYFTRVNEAQDLQQTITELAQKYQCSPKNVLEACIDPDTGNTVLHYCSANGFADLLPNFLAKLDGAEDQPTSNIPRLINHANQEGSTPLHWAAYNGHLAVVKLLIAARADMWIKNAAGHLAMFEAERADKSEVVQYLLEAGGQDVERGGEEGQPSAEDVAEVQEGEPENSPRAAGGPDSDVHASGSSG